MQTVRQLVHEACPAKLVPGSHKQDLASLLQRRQPTPPATAGAWPASTYACAVAVVLLLVSWTLVVGFSASRADTQPSWQLLRTECPELFATTPPAPLPRALKQRPPTAFVLNTKAVLAYRETLRRAGISPGKSGGMDLVDIPARP